MKKLEAESKSCFIYCRVSTDEQSKDGYSMDAQNDICLKKAKELGLNVVGVYRDEGETATTSRRPEFMRMLDNCSKEKIGVIIVYNTDRFARNTTDHFIIKDRLRKIGTRIVSVVQPMLDNSPEGKLLDTFLAGINQFYSDDLSRKTIRGLDKKFEEGYWQTLAPIGYKNVIDPQTNKHIVAINPVTAPIIVKAFELYATDNYNLMQLSDMLAEMGLKTKRGNPIGSGSLQQVLCKPFYYGMMVKGDKEILGKHTPIITKELFDVCQYVAAKRRNFLIRDRKHDFLLRGTITCSVCGRRYVGEYHKIKKQGKDVIIGYYHCGRNGAECKSDYVRDEELEEKVYDLFKSIKFSKAFTNSIKKRVIVHFRLRNITDGINTKLLLSKKSELIDKRDNLERRLLDSTIDRDGFKRLYEALKSEIATIDHEIAVNDISRFFDFEKFEEILAFVRNARRAYQKAPKYLKRKYLNFFFEKIEVGGKNIAKTSYSDLLKELNNLQLVILSTPMGG